MANTSTIYLSQADSATAAGVGRYRKDFARPGVWYINQAGKKTTITPERLKHWAEVFRTMQERGVSVPLTIDHLNPKSALARRGLVNSVDFDGDRGLFDATPADAEAEQLMLRCPEVSVEVEPEIQDGFGNKYQDAISAITLTPIPVIPGQSPWEKIALSRAGIPEGTPELFIPTTLAETITQESDSMKPETRKKLCLSMGIPDDSPDDKFELSLMDYFSKQADGKKAADTAQEKLSRLETESVARAKEVETLRAQLESKQPLKLSRDESDALLEAHEARTEKLVATGKITPAVAKKLNEYAKDQGVLMLSRAANDGSASRIRQITDILEDNDPAALGEQTRGQRTSLSREDPRGEKKQPDTDAVVKEANRLAAGGV